MSNRDNQLWLQLWRDKTLDFHQDVVNSRLTKFWPKLKLAKASKVFVPMCGKSLDMIWLAEQGHDVLGVELSPIAVRDFFKENGWKAKKSIVGDFTLWQYENIIILCGDFFSLTKDELGEIDIIYDRASLTALSEDTRKEYVTHLKNIIKNQTKIFLLTTEDADADMSLRRALGVDDEINKLYSAEYDIELAHVDSIYEFDTELAGQAMNRTEYKVYQLSSKIPDK